MGSKFLGEFVCREFLLVFVNTILTETITSENKYKSKGLGFFYLLDYERLSKRKQNKNSALLLNSFVCVACCCGLCMPSMIFVRANAKRKVGEFVCLSNTKAKAKEIPRFSAVSECCRSKRGQTQKHANERKQAQTRVCK